MGRVPTVAFIGSVEGGGLFQCRGVAAEQTNDGRCLRVVRACASVAVDSFRLARRTPGVSFPSMQCPVGRRDLFILRTATPVLLARPRPELVA
jgi:hypothetical protein